MGEGSMMVIKIVRMFVLIIWMFVMVVIWGCLFLCMVKVICICFSGINRYLMVVMVIKLVIMGKLSVKRMVVRVNWKVIKVSV